MVKLSTASPNHLSSSTDDDDDDRYESLKDTFTLIEEAEQAFVEAKVSFHDIYGSEVIDEIVRCNKMRRPTKSWRRSKSSKYLSTNQTSQSCRTLVTRRTPTNTLTTTTPIRSISKRSSSYRQIFDNENDDDDDDDDEYVNEHANEEYEDDLQMEIRNMRSYFANKSDYSQSPRSVACFDREFNNTSDKDYDDDPIRILKPRSLFGEAHTNGHLHPLPFDSDETIHPPPPIQEVESKKEQPQPQILNLQMTAHIPKKKTKFYNVLKKSKSSQKSNSYCFEIYVCCDDHNPSKQSSSSNHVKNANKWNKLYRSDPSDKCSWESSSINLQNEISKDYLSCNNNNDDDDDGKNQNSKMKVSLYSIDENGKNNEWIGSCLTTLKDILLSSSESPVSQLFLSKKNKTGSCTGILSIQNATLSEKKQ